MCITSHVKKEENVSQSEKKKNVVSRHRNLNDWDVENKTLKLGVIAVFL